MREKIKKYLNNTFLASSYYKKVNASNKVEVLKTMTFVDLDFIAALKTLFEGIKNNYNIFETKDNWKPSLRQKALINVITNIKEDISHNDNIKENNVLYIELIEDFYWQIYDYFDDYGNKEQLYKEEVDLLLPTIKDFFNKRISYQKKETI